MRRAFTETKAGMTSEYIPAALDDFVRRRAGDRCEYCKLPQLFQEAVFHVDHVHPRKRGGKTDANNLALACVSCSLRKAARVRVSDNLTGMRVPIFNPRCHRWSDHYAWERGWRIRGNSPIGRATVDALAMNRPSIVKIRIELAARGALLPN